MKTEAVVTEKAPKAVGPYSQGISAGNLVFSAGEIPIDPKDGSIPATIEGQADLALSNLIEVMKAGGVAPENICTVNVYLTDINDFAVVNTVYAKHFVEPYPARTCVAVAALPKNVKIMVNAIGVKN